MKSKRLKMMKALTLILALLTLVLLDQYAAGMKKTRIREFRNVPKSMLNRPKADVLILGSSTSEWLQGKRFRQASGLRRKQVTFALIPGGHVDANLATIWAAKATGKELHYKTCLLGMNHYQLRPGYRNSRTMQHRYITPLKNMGELFSIFLYDEKPLRMIGNYLACLGSNVYCDNGTFRRKVERATFGMLPKNRKYPWWEQEVLTQYVKKGKAPWRSNLALPRVEELRNCGALWESTAYKRRFTNQIMEELGTICDNTVVILHAIPSACFQMERGRENHLIDRYFEELVDQPQRHLINLGHQLGDLKYFSDDMHLNESGVKAYVKILARELVPILKQSRVKLTNSSRKN